MQKQQVIIIKSDSGDKEYAEKLYNRIISNYDDYSVILWDEDEYKRNKVSINDYDKVIFFGKARRLEDKAKDDNLRWKLNKFGMKYGWAGNICVIYAADDKLPWTKYFGNFKDYCIAMNEKYSDVPIPHENVLAGGYADVTGGDNAAFRSRYTALLHEFLDGGGFMSFMTKANPEAQAFQIIVSQLPSINEFPDVAEDTHWETLESRDGYQIQKTVDKRNPYFRIINGENMLIAWGKTEYEKIGNMAFLALFEEKIVEIVDTSEDKKKTGPVYKTFDALKPIEELISDAEAAIGDKTRTLKDSKLPDVLLMAHAEVAAAFIGGAAGFGTSFAILFIAAKATGLFGGAAIVKALAVIGSIFGGGMFAGVLVLAAPVAALAAGGAIIVAKVKAKEVQQAKERLLQKAIQTQHAILAQKKVEIDAVKQRADYLTMLNEALCKAIEDLRKDLS